MSAEFAIQKGLFDALTGIGLRVYDSAPQLADTGASADYPYVEIGAIVLGAFDTARETGFDFTARIHTRSRSSGMREAKDMQGQMYARLHRGSITITGQTLILIDRQTSDVTRQSDGSFHGICEYRGLVETI